METKICVREKKAEPYWHKNLRKKIFDTKFVLEKASKEPFLMFTTRSCNRFYWKCYTFWNPPDRETQISRYLAVQIHIEIFGLIWIFTEEFEFLDLMDFGGVAFSVESVQIVADPHAQCDRTYVHTYIRTYVHTYIRTYIHTYVHIYIRTYVLCMCGCVYVYWYTSIMQNNTRTHTHTRTRTHART